MVYKASFCVGFQLILTHSFFFLITQGLHTLMSHIPSLHTYLMHCIQLTYDNSNTYLISDVWGKFLFLCLLLFSESNHWKPDSFILCEHIIYTCVWNLHHYTMVLHYLYKINVLSIQGVYKVALYEEFQSILNYFFFLVTQSHILSCHTFLLHTVISCTLSNSHMIIQILAPLMMFGEKILFLSFPPFFELNHWKYGSHTNVGT